MIFNVQRWPASGLAMILVAGLLLQVSCNARKATPLPANGGLVTTLAGHPPSFEENPDGSAVAENPADTLGFANPSGVAVAADGVIYVADTQHHVIRRITPSGVVTTLAGKLNHEGNTDGRGIAARFFMPNALAVDGAGNLYVTDFGNHSIRKITPDGTVTTLAGGNADTYLSQDGQGTQARFKDVQGIAVDNAGTVYVADNQTIRRISPKGAVSTFAGLAGRGGRDDGGSVDGVGSAARFGSIQGLALDKQGTLYVADMSNSLIRKVSSAGKVTTLTGLTSWPDSTAALVPAPRFSLLDCLTVGDDGTLYVTNDNVVLRITPAGRVSTLAGQPDESGYVDGPGTVARFRLLGGIAQAADGALYVVDSNNNTLRVVR